MSKIRIQYIPVTDIRPYKNNPRKNDKAIEAVAASIKEFGFKNPIILDANNEIIAGHTRLKAAEKLGLKEVPCIMADDLTDAQIRAYRLADNKTSELAEWDDDLLAAELQAIEGIDMSLFGFDAESTINPDDIDEDEVPEPLPEDIAFDGIKKGEVWQLGRHRLMCGDSTDPEDIESLMAGETVQLFLTDPPYNVAYEADNGDTVTNDDLAEDSFYEFLTSAMKAAYDVMDPGAAFYIWHADSNGLVFRQVCEETGLHIRECLIWVKNAFTFGRQDYQWQHEPCLYGWKEGAAHYFVNDHTMSTIIMDDTLDLDALKKNELRDMLNKLLEAIRTSVILEHKPLKNDLHPTMKPVKIFARLVFNSTKEGDNVLDVFGGSGTAIIACEQLNRTCFMMELEPRFCQVIIKRWEALTGQTAVRL